MSKRSQKGEHLVDLSARSKLKIENASQNEMEQNQKTFKELNELIDSEIKAYSKQLNIYISDLQKKSEIKRKNCVFNHHSSSRTEHTFPQYRRTKTRYIYIYVLAACICMGMVNLLQMKENVVYKESKVMAKCLVINDNISVKDVEKENKTPPPSQFNEGENTTVVQNIELRSDFTKVIPASYEYMEDESRTELLTLRNAIVAQDTATGEQLSLEQLSGKKLLISYVESGKEIYFLGQYSENCNWDGCCITNVYNSDGTLYGICEYNFKDGVSLACKSIYNSETAGEWIYVNRKYKDGEGDGESIRYSLNYVDSKNIEDANVEVDDIMYIDNFLKENETVMLSYYKGKMSDGRYNDKSGQAYLITYFKPNSIEGINVPVIKTLYMGKFVDGKFFEEDYESWYITRGIETTYMYYKGGFLNGSVQHKDRAKEVFENELTHERIDEYLNKYGLSEYSDQFVTEYENRDDY